MAPVIEDPRLRPILDKVQSGERLSCEDGVTLFRTVFRRGAGDRVALGQQHETFEGARVFVLPNPSGRNANFSYDDMLAAFRRLRPLARRPRAGATAARIVKVISPPR